MTQETFQKPDGWTEFTVRQKVVWWISRLLPIDEAKVTADANLVVDLGVDSLDIVEIVMRLEDEFELTISDAEAAELKTVDLIVECIEKKLFGAITNVAPAVDFGPEFNK